MNAQQLKNSILQLAVQGKLVPQDPNDEPASALIERIRAEKEKLIKEKKIKPDKNPSYIFRGSDNLPYEKMGKNEPVCIADEVPFDIPDSWEWVRFKDLVNYSMGKTPPRKEYIYWDNPSLPWVSIADLNNNGYVNSTKEKINNYAADNIFKNKISKSGTLLMSFKLTVGKVSILSIDAFHNEAIISIYPYVDDNKIMTNFLFNILPLLSQNGNTKTAIKGNTLNSESLDALFMPLPPLNEQRRIVEKLEKIEPYINDYDKAYEKIEKLNTDFPDLLKKSILQEAVQGKLVLQDPNDEPASVLIEKIRQEKEQLIKDKKIKKDKNESYIFRRYNSHYEKIGSEERCIDDEIPFDIPDSWEWVRLGSICNYGSCINIESIDISDETWVLDLEDIEKDTGKLLTKKSKKDVKSLSTKHKFIKGQVLYSKLRPYLNKVIVADEDGCCTSEILPITFYGSILPEYAQLFLMSPYFVSYANQCSYGVKMPRLGTDDGKNAYFALPPINEQHRIIQKVKELLPKIKTLK